MARRERKPLTQRERQCRKVAREKALWHLLHSCWRRLCIALLAATTCAALAAGAWEYQAQGVSRTMWEIIDGAYRVTARWGFAVQALYLEGRRRTPLYEVSKALALTKGTPILALSLAEMRERLEALPTVKHASVERALPGTLHIRLVEREPVAIWQHRGSFSLIDDEGEVMRDLALEDHKGLPLVVGEGAPRHVAEILTLLASEPELAFRVVAAVRVGDRRWNVHLRGDIEIKLPEEGALAAWNRLAGLARERQLLDRALRTVDLRQKDRLTLRLLPAALPSASVVPARET